MYQNLIKSQKIKMSLFSFLPIEIIANIISFSPFNILPKIANLSKSLNYIIKINNNEYIFPLLKTLYIDTYYLFAENSKILDNVETLEFDKIITLTLFKNLSAFKNLKTINILNIYTRISRKMTMFTSTTLGKLNMYKSNSCCFYHFNDIFSKMKKDVNIYGFIITPLVTLVLNLNTLHSNNMLKTELNKLHKYGNNIVVKLNSYLCYNEDKEKITQTIKKYGDDPKIIKIMINENIQN